MILTFTIFTFSYFLFYYGVLLNRIWAAPYPVAVQHNSLMNTTKHFFTFTFYILTIETLLIDQNFPEVNVHLPFVQCTYNPYYTHYSFSVHLLLLHTARI
jgi:hypothetical protein